MDQQEYRRRQKLKMMRKKRRRKKKLIQLAVLAAMALILIVILSVSLIKKLFEKEDGEKADSDEVKIEETIDKQLEEAEYLAATYDYDAAIVVLKTIEDYEVNEEVQALIAQYEETKASCVPVNIEEVTHIFYHSLVVDPERAFANQETDSQAAGNNQWMTTISEFNEITQEMYDRGYVMVSIHDLIQVTQDENGETIYEPATIMLPPGKKAFVLSIDDLSYYHAYEGYGYASRLVLDEEGNVINEYIDAEGNVTTGLYDVVPLMDKFIEEHPDASYRGAKGIIALTGYNGILGYRTDETYDLEHPDCDSHQRAWIESHPGFNLEEERAEAKKVADAMKKNGWEFASHTWGHLRVGQRSLETIKVDTEKWKRNIEPLVGTTDTIIFAHGEDLQGEGDYSESNAKYQYLRSEGYTIFCNVDSHQYTAHFGEDYMRQGRRNIDGYRIYRNATGVEDNLSDLFDAKEILDPARPPVLAL